MHEFASFNHEILPVSEINIKAVSSAALYGRSIFTTLAIYAAEPFLWEKHRRRLEDNARRLEIDLSAYPENKVRQTLETLIKKNKFSDGRCRITFFDESAGKIWPSGSEDKTSLLIQTADFRKNKKNLSADVSAYPVNSKSPLAGIKSCNYLENIIALSEAEKDGFNEMIRYNERTEVVSFCMGNIFWLEYEEERLYTPSLKTGCLAGTTRELVLEKFEVFEVEKEINEFFRDAEAIFLTSAGTGVSPVTVSEPFISNERIHPILNLIQTELDRTKN